MEKKCFVIMPTSDPDGYVQGHFNRVYQYIIVPACKSAGFQPIRADDPASNEIGLDIVKTVIDSEIAICDVSAKNSNALYGFAVRQAVNLPVILVRDMKTKTVFDIEEFGGVMYDESLRIDTVEKEIETLAKTLNEIFANKVTNSLLTRLGIGVAAQPEIVITPFPEPTEEDESSKKRESALPRISPLPDYVGDPITQLEIDSLKIGDAIFHVHYGKGEIKIIRKAGKDKMATIHFGSESKLLVLVPSEVFRKIRS